LIYKDSNHILFKKGKGNFSLAQALGNKLNTQNVCFCFMNKQKLDLHLVSNASCLAIWERTQ